MGKPIDTETIRELLEKWADTWEKVDRAIPGLGEEKLREFVGVLILKSLHEGDSGGAHA